MGIGNSTHMWDSQDRNASTGKDPEPSRASRSTANSLAKMAKEYYAQTAPARSAYLGQGMDILNGGDPSALPGVASQNALARRTIDPQYQQAREGVLSSTARGGAQDYALAGLERQKAENIAGSQQQNATNAVQKFVDQLYQAAFGAPAVAEQGLGSAAQNIASLYQTQANRYGSTVGGQVGSGQATTSCCFIFLAFGPLDPVVRRYRDEHMTPRNRRGYYRLADFLVPRMERSRLWTWAVRMLMVDPMTCYGRWVYDEGKLGAIFAPVAHFWLTVFNVAGFGTYTRCNGETV